MDASQNKMTKTEFYNMVFSAKGREQKRTLLKDLSNTAKMLLDANPDLGDTVNDVILNVMYKSKEHATFHSFKQWKEKGFSVKKGSKCFFIWSKPIRAKKKDADVKETKDDDKNTFKMFGIATLFSNAQVEPLKA